MLRQLAALFVCHPRPRLKSGLTHAKLAEVGWGAARPLRRTLAQPVSTGFAWSSPDFNRERASRVLCALLLAAILAGCAIPDGAAAPEATTAAEPATTAIGEPSAASNDAAAPVAAPAATVEPADTGVEQPQPAEGAAAGASENVTTSDSVSSASAPPETAALALAAPSELLDSYRMAASLVITSFLPGGGTHIANTQVQGEWMRSDGPFGFDAAITLLNSRGDQRQELSLVAIGDDAAVRTEGAWSTVRRDATLPYGGPDSLLSLPLAARINSGENLGSENLGGVPVTHYRLTDPAVYAAAVQGILPDGEGSVQSLLLEGWVADAGFVMKYLLQATLADADFVDDAGNHVAVQQQIDVSYVLSDLDAVRAIEWPADAQPPETIAVPGFVPNTFPIPDGATATPHLGLVEIRTPQTEAEVTSFYRARLTELGWSVAGELGFYTAAKEGQTISLTILPDEASRETVVRVFAAVD